MNLLELIAAGMKKIPVDLAFKPTDPLNWTKTEEVEGKSVAKSLGVEFFVFQYHIVKRHIKTMDAQEFFEAAKTSLRRKSSEKQSYNDFLQELADEEDISKDLTQEERDKRLIHALREKPE